jgi:hypothetical protein
MGPVLPAAPGFFAKIGSAIAGFFGSSAVKYTIMAATAITGVKGFRQMSDLMSKGQDIMVNKTAAGGKIPVIYGTRRVGAQVVYMDTSQNRSKDLFVVYALAVGECEEILGETIEIDGNSILDGNVYRGGGYVGSDKIASGAGSLNIASQVGDNQYSNAGTLGTDPTLRYSFVFNLHHGTSLQVADPMLRASIPSQWSTNHKLGGICYIAASFDYDKKGMYRGLPQITVQVMGKKVYDPRNSSTAWSSNPALCLLDYIQNDQYGKGLATADINMTTFEDAADVCDVRVNQPYYGASFKTVTFSGTSGNNYITVSDNADWFQNKVDENITVKDSSDVTVVSFKDITAMTQYEFFDGSQENRIYFRGTLSTSYTNEVGTIRSKVNRFHCNGVVDTNKKVMDNAKDLLSNMRGIFNYVEGKYELQIEDTGSSTFSITDDHIIADAGISIDYGSKDKKANKVIVEFFNANLKYELDTATQLHDATPEYYSDDGEILEIKAEFPFITDPYIASNMAKAILERSRNQTTIQFLGTPEMYKLNVGDIVDITYSGLDLSSANANNVFRIEALELQANGLVSVSAIEYLDIYSWEVPAEEAVAQLANLPTLGAIQPPQNVTFTDTDSSAINRPIISWDNPTIYPAKEFRVDITDSSSNPVMSKIVDTNSADLSFIPKGADYNYSITSINSMGFESDPTTSTFTIADDPVKTTEVEMNGVTLSDVETYGTVTGKTGNYVKFTNKVDFEDEVLFRDFLEVTGSAGVSIDSPAGLSVADGDINAQGDVIVVGELKGKKFAYSYYNSTATTLTTSYATVNLDTLQSSTGISGITIASDVVTISRTGTFMITMDVTTDIPSGSSRTKSEAQLYKNGSAVTGTLVGMYNRSEFQGINTGSTTTMLSITSGDTLEIKAKKSGSGSPETSVGGTRLTILQVG